MIHSITAEQSYSIIIIKISFSELNCFLWHSSILQAIQIYRSNLGILNLKSANVVRKNCHLNKFKRQGTQKSCNFLFELSHDIKLAERCVDSKFAQNDHRRYITHYQRSSQGRKRAWPCNALFDYGWSNDSSQITSTKIFFKPIWPPDPLRWLHVSLCVSVIWTSATEESFGSWSHLSMECLIWVRVNST